MLTQELDRETERYLTDILAQENTTSDELIRNLIRDRWLSLNHSVEVANPQSEMTTVTSGQFPRPKNSKQVIADFVRKKSQRAL